MGVLEEYKSVLAKLAEAHKNHTQLLQKRSNSSAVLSNIQNELQRLKSSETQQIEEYANSMYQRAKDKYAPLLTEVERLKAEQLQLQSQVDEKINSYDTKSFEDYFDADFELLGLSSVSIYLLYAIQQFYGVGCSQVLGHLDIEHVPSADCQVNIDEEQNIKESKVENKEENTNTNDGTTDDSSQDITDEQNSDNQSTPGDQDNSDTKLRHLQYLLKDIKVSGFKDISQLVDEVVGRTPKDTDPLHFEALETTYEKISYERSVELLGNLVDELNDDNISASIYEIYQQCLRYVSQSDEASGLKTTMWDKMQAGVKILGKFLESQQSRFKWKYTIHAGVIGASILLLCTYPMVFVGVGASVAAGVYYINHKKAAFIKGLDDYSEYIIAYMSLKCFLAEQFDTEYSAYCEALQVKVNQINSETALLIQDYNNQYQRGVTSVNVDRQHISETVRLKMQEQYNSLDTRIQSATANVSALDEEIRKSDISLAGLQQEVQNAKQNVKSTYWDLQQVGTSKLFPTSFAIGFSGNELITLDYVMTPMTFIYTGQSSRGNSTLITMIMAQILCNIAPTLVYITLVDTQFGCADYKSLAPLDDKMDIFEYITLSKDLKNFLERTHTEVTMQERLILPHADNITEFNEIKIQRNSFTTEYHVVIFQDLEKATLESEEFIQILRNGPRVGIIPIVFVADAYVREIKRSTKDDEKKWMKILLEESRKSTWTFNQNTLDVEADTGAAWFPGRK